MPGKKIYVVAKKSLNKQGTDDKEAEINIVNVVPPMGDNPIDDVNNETVAPTPSPHAVPHSPNQPLSPQVDHAIGFKNAAPIIENYDSDEDSEFVDATQAIDMVQRGQDIHASDPRVIHPEIVQKDIAFLKESWANMADLEDNTVLFNDELEMDGFQPVISKASKKASRRSPKAPKSPYTTRSRGGQSKGAQ
jgi:hypothetical protein